MQVLITILCNIYIYIYILYEFTADIYFLNHDPQLRLTKTQKLCLANEFETFYSRSTESFIHFYVN